VVWGGQENPLIGAFLEAFDKRAGTLVRK